MRNALLSQRSVTLPQQLPSGQWNCSVPEWPEFQPHFACDLMPECVGGEDEVDCPYTGHCGQGKLSISDGCYEFVHSDKELTWTQASNICRERNGHLVALNTPDETREVLKVLDLMTSDSYFPVGLQSTVYEGLPDMYVPRDVNSHVAVALITVLSVLVVQWPGPGHADTKLPLVQTPKLSPP